MLYFLNSNGVTIDIYHSWNKAFAALQELRSRDIPATINMVVDRRTPKQMEGEC